MAASQIKFPSNIIPSVVCVVCGSKTCAGAAAVVVGARVVCSARVCESEKRE